MNESLHPILKMAREDGRYKLEAYLFVFEALGYAQKELGLGAEVPGDVAAEDRAAEGSPAEEPRTADSGEESDRPERHVSGQQLCEAIRQFALEQYGYMAKCVLNSWGIHQTGDFGEIVFNLIRIRQMRKTKEDRREDFDNVFDFDAGLVQGFSIKPPD